MYDSRLSHIITTSIIRLHTEMVQTAPFMAQQVEQWIKHLSGLAQPEDYFKHPLAFPSLLLPWWLEKTVGESPDLSLQAELVYSTMNGYYYIRLIDNLMDGDTTIEMELLPALNFFHTQFQSAYYRYFEHDHPFWDFFRAIWFFSAEATMKDASLTDIDETQFEKIVAQKVCAAKIPLAAVCYTYNRLDKIEPWSRFVDLFGCWHQWLNDLFDWHKDERQNTHTYFLCEAERRRNENESIAGWVAREGFTWAIEKSQGWMTDMKRLAIQLQSTELAVYLDSREARLMQQKADVTKGLQSLARIVEATGR